MPTDSRDHAVVLGASVSGLLTAKVLADAFANVTVIERDRLPVGAEHRQGVPHGQHVHGMLPRGVQVIEELLPGITDELIARGALVADILGNTRWYLAGRMLRQTETGLPGMSASRPLIELALRDRVRALSNVSVLEGYDAVGLCVAPDQPRVTGVRTTSRYGEGSRILPADLVVDATGRGSRTPTRLVELGYAAPEQDRVNIDLSYASRIFEAPESPFGDDIVVVIARFPGQKRSGVMQRLEGGRVLVTLAGVLGERPPADLPSFTAYAASLAAPDAYDLVRSAQPVGDAVPFRLPTYVRHRYERLAELPAGLLATGDAVCGFNPVYGQGMSVAAAAAATLREELRHGGAPDPHRYFEAVARSLDAPWGLAVGADLALIGSGGPSLPKSPMTAEYLGQLQLAAAVDPVLSTAFIRVTSLIDPPAALLRPEIVERVLAHAGAPDPGGAPVPNRSLAEGALDTGAARLHS